MVFVLLAVPGVGTAEETAQLSDVADRVSASVVSVQAEKVEATPAAEWDAANIRQGTGLVLSANGLIVTATAVVEKVGKITLTFADGQQAPAQVVGRDPRTGVALLKETRATGLHPVQFAEANVLRRGTPVFSIGNVYGLQQSLSSGIISAVRPHNTSHLVLQTDLVVHPGSLGAPLFNMKGEVVGMFASRYAVSGKPTGVALAVSSNLLRHVTDRLQKFGVVDRGWIGIRTRKPTDEEAHALNMGAARGLLVVKVLDGGPAAAAGLAPGDGIDTFNGEPVQDPAALGWLVTSTAPNTEVTLGLLRKSGPTNLHIKLGHLPEMPSPTASTTTASPASSDKNPTCLHYIPTAGMTVAVPCEE
jgi:serine protease Do